MNTSTTTTHSAPEALRARMVDQILQAGWARSAAVAGAMRTVPRHRFVPTASVEDAYADIAVITKKASDGTALSCASVPTIVAMMLDQLDVQPGQRILEIGAGTGYNAALLAELAGAAGHVTTVDIDAEVTAQARQALDATGYGGVDVITKDGALGGEEHAPYDRVILTVGAWDLPPAFWNQLAPGGRLVVPLRWRGQTRSLSFVRQGDRLWATSAELCGFVPMIGQEGERTAHIDSDGHVSLHWDADQPIDPAALTGVLQHPKAVVWSDVTVGPYDPFDGVWLRMTGTEPGTCRISAQPAALETGLCTPAIASRSPALVEDDSLAYFTLRRLDDDAERRSVLGATGHGAAGQELAERICQEICEWDQDRAAQTLIAAYPAGTPGDELPAGMIIDKSHSRLIVIPSN